MEDSLTEFIRFCKGYVQEKVVRLLKTRISECTKEFQNSSDLENLMQITQAKVSTDKKNVYVHIQDFLEEVKRHKDVRKTQSKTSKRKADDSAESDNVASFPKKQWKDLQKSDIEERTEVKRSSNSFIDQFKNFASCNNRSEDEGMTSGVSSQEYDGSEASDVEFVIECEEDRGNVACIRPKSIKDVDLKDKGVSMGAFTVFEGSCDGSDLSEEASDDHGGTDCRESYQRDNKSRKSDDETSGNGAENDLDQPMCSPDSQGIELIGSEAGSCEFLFEVIENDDIEEETIVLSPDREEGALNSTETYSSLTRNRADSTTEGSVKNSPMVMDNLKSVVKKLKSAGPKFLSLKPLNEDSSSRESKKSECAEKIEDAEESGGAKGSPLLFDSTCSEDGVSADETADDSSLPVLKESTGAESKYLSIDSASEEELECGYNDTTEQEVTDACMAPRVKIDVTRGQEKLSENDKESGDSRESKTSGVISNPECSKASENQKNLTVKTSVGKESNDGKLERSYSFKKSEFSKAAKDKESEADEEQPSTSKCSTSDSGMSQKDTNSQSAAVKEDKICRKESRKKGSKGQIKRLEKLLEDLKNKIEELKQREVSLDEMDDEESAYLMEDRYQKKFVKVWNKLCELKGRAPTTGRPLERKFMYSGSRYPEINRKVEKFINKTKQFPDFHDIRQIVDRVNKRKGLGMRSALVDQQAREVFTDVGDQLQRRRQADLVMTFTGHLTNIANAETEEDPAAANPDLHHKLNSSESEGRQRLNDVIDKYVRKQYDREDRKESSGEGEGESEETESDEEEVPEMDHSKVYQKWVTHASEFLSYLKIFTVRYGQLETREGSFQQLFQHFAKICLLAPEIGNALVSHLKVKGTDVSGIPDVRFPIFLKSGGQKTLVFTIAEVKLSHLLKENKDSFSLGNLPDSVLGQLGIELLLEYKRSLFRPAVIGLICIGTKLVFTVIEVDAEKYARVQAEDTPEENERSTILYSKPYDYMDRYERSEILEICFWLGQSGVKQLHDLIKVLTDLSGKLSSSLNAQTSETAAPVSSERTPVSAERSSQSSRRNVTAECKNAVRQVYKTLRKGDPAFGYSLEKDVRFISQQNETTTKRLAKGVKDFFGGREKCPYSTADIEKAAKTYFKSLKDAERRRERGTSSRHVTMSRRQNRKRERATRLVSALKTANWTPESKEKIRPLLTAEYMSSEESDVEDGHKIFKVRRLPWQKKKFLRAKDMWDEEYEKELQPHQKGLRRRRLVLEIPSARKPPKSCPEWMLGSSWCDIEDDSTDAEED